jgi:hypothetical protein
MNFIPETSKTSVEVPYYDDVTGEAGWQGHSTTKSIERLKSEIVESISRLGGMVTNFQRGKFEIETKTREGFRVHYMIETTDGRTIPGRIDIAALPVRTGNNRTSMTIRLDKSLRMSLYMLRTALDGTWFLQQLSPGYAPLMPWMLADGEKTITQLWQESSVMQNLLPPGETDFVEGEYK